MGRQHKTVLTNQLGTITRERRDGKWVFRLRLSYDFTCGLDRHQAHIINLILYKMSRTPDTRLYEGGRFVKQSWIFKKLAAAETALTTIAMYV